jgi:hypothetical protein
LGDCVDLPNGFSDFDGLTLCAWACPSNARGWAGFIDLGNGSPDNNIFFGQSSTTLALAIVTGTGGLGTLTAPTTVNMNTWQHFAATVDACGYAVLYKNGLPVKTGTIQPPWNVTRTLNHIGRSNWSGITYYRGLLDDIRVYRRPLDPNDIADLVVWSMK